MRSYQIGLLTNIYRGSFERGIKNGSIPDVEYKKVVKSCDVGLIKPDPAIYKYAQHLVNTPGENILFIDDNKSYIKAAEECGWSTVLFDTQKPKESIQKILLFL